MKTVFHIFRFEWKSLWRSNTLKVLLSVFLLAGIYGIYFGKFEIDKQADRILKFKTTKNNKFDSLLHWLTLDTSIAINRDKLQKAISPTGAGRSRHFTFYVANDASPTAGLCLGQRDLFPVYYGFNITDLARQMNVGELANPMKLLTGNFDLSYVIVFIFPLLIIALFYDLYAAEQESGTLGLLRSQSVALNTVLFGKGTLRLSIILGLAAGLLILGFLLQGVSLTDHTSLFFQWLGLTYIYCLFGQG